LHDVARFGSHTDVVVSPALAFALSPSPISIAIYKGCRFDLEFGD
jgi:hypothetical protein